jgi:outer membrane protein TolC
MNSWWAFQKLVGERKGEVPLRGARSGPQGGNVRSDRDRVLANRRGGPIAPLIVLVMLLPACGGCWWDHFHRNRNDDPVDPIAAQGAYYQSVANSAPPFQTGVELEIPMNPPPLTSRSPEARRKWQMTLREAIEIALRNSNVVREIRGQVVPTAVGTAYDPAIAETRVQQELARFDTSMIFNLFWGKEELPLNSNVAPGGGTVNIATGNPFIFRQDTFGSVAGRNTLLQGTGDILSLRKLLATGGELNFGFNTDYTLSNVPEGNRAFRAAYETRFFTSFRQPLLQGAGVDVNRAPIIIARLQADKSLWDFKQLISQLIRDVEQKYWELVISEAQYQAMDKAIELSTEAVDRLKLGLEAGTGNEADLIQAEQQLETLQSERINALSGGSLLSPSKQRLIGGPVLQVEQQLRALLGLPSSDGCRIVPADEPEVAPVELDWYNIVIDAYTYNPELQGAKLIVAARRQALTIAADGLKPRLDAVIRKDFNGLGSEFDDSIKMINHEGFGAWYYGLQFQYTFGYRAASGLLQQRRLELDQERAVLRAKAQEIEHTLAEQYRQVIARFDSWTKSHRALELAERRVRMQRLLYDAEKERALEQYLDAVQKYADAVTEEVANRSAYQIALINLEVTKGTIFKFNNVHVHEDDWPDAAYPQAAQQAADRERAIPWPHKKQANLLPQDQLQVYGPQRDESSQPGGYGSSGYGAQTTPPAKPAGPVAGPSSPRTDGIPLTGESGRSIGLILPNREPGRSIDLILPSSEPGRSIDLILPTSSELDP